MPSEAGIQFEEVMKKTKTFRPSKLRWIPAFAGMTALFFIATQPL
jgi:hypothetical protein